MSTDHNRLVALVLALISVLASYVGLDQSLPYITLWWKLFAAALAAGVGIAIYVFWTSAFETATNPEQFRYRRAGWITTLVGCLFLLGMSSWWNVAATGAPEARRAALYETLKQGEEALAHIRANSNNHTIFVPRIDGLAAELRKLETCESEGGCVTGSRGKGGISQLLSQLAEKAETLSTSLRNQDKERTEKAASGSVCLRDLRSALAKNKPEDQVTETASEAFDCLNGVIADLAANAPLLAISQEMNAFSSGLILPTSIKSDNQKAAAENILEGLEDRAKSIAADASALVKEADIKPLSLPRMSAMKAVVLYWDSIIPSWILGISLDLLPLLLLSFRATNQASSRAQPGPLGDKMTVAEIKTALEVTDFLADALSRQNKVMTPPETVTAPNVSPVNRIRYRTIDDTPDYWEEPLILEALPDVEEREKH